MQLTKRIVLYLFCGFWLINTSLFFYFEHVYEIPYKDEDHTSQEETLLDNLKYHIVTETKVQQLDPVKSQNTITSIKHLNFTNYNKSIKYCEFSRSQVIPRIITHRDTYQYLNFSIKEHIHSFKAYLLNFYFDDRFYSTIGQLYIRTVISIKGPEDPWNPQNELKRMMFWWKTLETPQYGLLWYETYMYPVQVSCYTQHAAYLLLNVNGSFYYQYLVNCPIPVMGDILPTHMSVSSSPQCEIPTNFKQILHPEVNVKEDDKHRNNQSTRNNIIIPSNETIGLCLQPLFGKMDKNDVNYLISWMELLKLFGVKEVTVTNISLTLQDDEIRRVFDYYQTDGFFKVFHYPQIHPNINTAQDEFAGSYSVKQMVVSDCYFRKIKKYWYVLIHDLDELIVPKKHQTYQDFFNDYLAKNKTARNDDCLSVRSAYFYRNMPLVKNNSFPDYIPQLKYTSRFEPEPFGIASQGGVGMVKSFSKMSTLVAAGSHMCREIHNSKYRPKQSYLNSEDILIHHYRKHCDSIHGNDVRCSYDNQTLHKSLMHDDSLYKYADELILKVNQVLVNLKR